MVELNELSSLGEYSERAKRVNFKTFSSGDYVTSEAYKALRTNLFFCGAEVKTIVLTSCDENEGKSTVSAELSKSLAESGKRTLLIDADMRKSVMLRKGARTGNISGLSEFLSGLTAVHEVIHPTQNEKFDVMFSGHFPPNPVELIGNGKFEALLKELKEQYDYIIIDSPPLGMVIDAAVIASLCDGAVMVISSGKVSKAAARSVKEQLEKSGCRLLGAVVNESEKENRFNKKYYYGSREYR